MSREEAEEEAEQNLIKISDKAAKTWEEFVGPRGGSPKTMRLFDSRGLS